MPKASAFIRSLARYPHFGGGYGNSKTTSLCLKILNDLQNYPSSVGAICRNTNVQLERTTRRTFFEILGCNPENARTERPDLIDHWNKSSNFLRFKNGSELYFLYLEGEKAIQNIQSMNLTFVGIDQVEQVSRLAFEEFDGRIRFGPGPHYIASVSNPAGHNWLWRKYFIEKRGHKDWPMWIAATMENPFLPADFVPNLLENHSQDWVNRFVYGSFDAFGGQVYEEWNEKIHVINNFDVPDDWKWGYGADFGYRNPTVFEGVAIDYSGNLIVYDEVTNRQQVPRHYAEVLKDPIKAKTNQHRIWSKRLQRDLPIYGDPSMINSDLITGTNIQEEYFRHGVLIFEGNRQRTTVGVQRIKDFMKIDWTKPHPFKPGVMGASKLYVMRRCPLLIEEMPEMQWVPDRDYAEEAKSVDPQEKLRKKDDHAHDALKYFILSHSALAGPTAPRTRTVLEEERERFDREGEVEEKHWSEV